MATFSTLMTHVQSEPAAAPRLASAADLAKRVRARLVGVGAEMIPPLAFDNGYYSVDADWVIALRGTVEDQLRAARTAFERVTADFPPGDAVWLSGIETPTPALAAASRAADLIVLGGAPRRRESAYSDCEPAEVAIQSGRPVLVAPSSAPRLNAERIVLAWKDTREARRALSEGVPFFEAAGAVLVLEVCDEADRHDAGIRTDDVVAYLRRRGVAAEAKVVLHDHAPASERIIDQARAFRADLIVVGCYGHSRMGEWAFGGVTRDLLAQDEVYLLLSH